ncbi:hypothetical protein ACLB1T_01060 [Escherichia coli]
MDTTIEGGLQTVFGGGSVSGTLINTGEQQVSRSGSAVGTTINGDCRLFSVVEVSPELSLIPEQQVSSGGRPCRDTTIEGTADCFRWRKCSWDSH